MRQVEAMKHDIANASGTISELQRQADAARADAASARAETAAAVARMHTHACVCMGAHTCTHWDVLMQYCSC